VLRDEWGRKVWRNRSSGGARFRYYACGEMEMAFVSCFVQVSYTERYVQLVGNNLSEKKENYTQMALDKILRRLYNENWRKIMMESIVIDRKILPEPIFSYIHSERIRIFEENGNIVLSPLKIKQNVNELFGMFNDGKLSSEGFIKQKAIEKEMEN
jgi:hypothetical protein